MNENSDYELYHYGVPGMKWGVRRTRDQLRRSRGKKGKSEVDDPKVKKSSRPKSTTRDDLSKMTDDELRQKINRIRMEMDYVKLTTPPPSKRRVVAKIFSDTVDQEYKNAAKSIATEVVRESLKSAINKK